MILLSRRCTQRQLLLRPDKVVDGIYEYCLAEAALRCKITLYAWTAMSNHHHVLIRDNVGNFPEFLAHLHKMLAKAMNAYRGRWENFWASEQPNAVWTVDTSDAFDKLVYVLANPVADDLVDRVSDWPGASSLVQILSGRAKRVRRPRVFFRDDGTMPAEVMLHAERLAGFEALSQDEWKSRVLVALEKAERKARDARRERKRHVLGRRNVLSASPESRPTTVEPRGGLRPCIACKDPVRRIFELGLLRAFRIAHRTALGLWRGGDHAAVFPRGTYKMLWYGAAVG